MLPDSLVALAYVGWCYSIFTFQPLVFLLQAPRHRFEPLHIHDSLYGRYIQLLEIISCRPTIFQWDVNRPKGMKTCQKEDRLIIYDPPPTTWGWAMEEMFTKIIWSFYNGGITTSWIRCFHMEASEDLSDHTEEGISPTRGWGGGSSSWD